MMNHHTAKFFKAPDAVLANALADCHVALGMSEVYSPAYISKLWAEIDAIRDIQMTRRSKILKGFKPASEYTIGCFDRWGTKPYLAVLECTKGGRGKPTYDLTILAEGNHYRAAHGSVIVDKAFNHPADAAQWLLTWYKEQA
jgi:hypothetical protein